MSSLLAMRGVETFYGSSQALFGVSLVCREGEVTTLLGRNGMGKTTTVNSIMGIVAPRRGEVLFNGEPIHGKRPHQIAQRGVGLVPEGRQIFPNLSVKENLIATATGHETAGAWTLQKVLDFFPRLSERLNQMGNQLSGGEQQMLAIGRALMLNPQLLILDEATEGLAPLIRAEIWQRLAELKQTGMSILLIDKNLDEFTAIADQHTFLEKGQVMWQGSAAELAVSAEMKARYLGV